MEELHLFLDHDLVNPRTRNNEIGVGLRNMIPDAHFDEDLVLD